MSKITKFLQQVPVNPDLQEKIKNITDPNLIVKIAEENDYSFTVQKLAEVIFPLKTKYDNNLDFLSKTKPIEGLSSSRAIKADSNEVLAMRYFHNNFFQELKSYQ